MSEPGSHGNKVEN